MKLLPLALALVSFAAATHAVESTPTQRDHLTVQLISNVTAAAPGSTVEVGLRLVHEPEWHTYWLNPGDSGLPTKLQWTLPEGVTVSDIRWPLPHRMDLDPLTNFGYDGEIVLPVEVSVPAAATVGSALDLNVKASWLICREECIPGDAPLQLKLPIGPASIADPRWQPVFEAARQTAPQPMSWKTQVNETTDAIEVIIDDQGQLADVNEIEIFPFSTTLIAHRAGAVTRTDAGELKVTTPKSDYYEPLSGDANFLVAYGHGEDRRGVYVSTGDTAVGASTTLAQSETQASSSNQTTLAAAFLFAFVGGLLLNLMPCVLPVLSLKALGLAEHAHDRATSRRHGLLYLAGTLVCFLGLAGVLLALRGAGEALGWGFQLQTPWVVASLAMLMTVMGLSLSGMFEFGTSWMGMGQQLTEGNNSRGAFFSGALAAVVASPCTAPFMGPALGFAVTQPTAVAISIFVALGVGLALPIVALSFAPALARWLPKPGAWMVRFKQLLAYPLYLTAIWLLWVLGRQLGADGMALTLVGVLALVLALWIWRSMQPNLVPRVLATLAFAGAVATLAALGRLPAMSTAVADAPASLAKPWSAQALSDLRSEGKPVLVNMTATWCITCLANERVALSSQQVQDTLSRLEVTYLKGDWTNRDENITQYLAQFGRNGVPLYVLYPRGGGEPEVLPQILTPTLVTAALEKAAQP